MVVFSPWRPDSSDLPQDIEDDQFQALSGMMAALPGTMAMLWSTWERYECSRTEGARRLAAVSNELPTARRDLDHARTQANMDAVSISHLHRKRDRLQESLDDLRPELDNLH